MDVFNKAFELYEMKCYQDGDQTMEKLSNHIQSYVWISINTTRPITVLFSNQSVVNTLLNSLSMCMKNRNNDVSSLSKAFVVLERYFQLLVLHPWKSEYKTLKTYGGYYKTNIKSILRTAESIFLEAGFHLDTLRPMVYHLQIIEERKLTTLAFECFVASEICKQITNKIHTIGFTLENAMYEIFQETLGNNHVNEMFSIDKNLNKSKNISSDEFMNKKLPVIEYDYDCKPHSSISFADYNDKENMKQLIGSNSIQLEYPVENSEIFDSKSLGVRRKIPKQNTVEPSTKRYSDGINYYLNEEEHHPEFSQATSEDHIRESSKLVHARSLQDSFNQDSYIYSPVNYPPSSSNATQYHQKQNNSLPIINNGRFRDQNVISKSKEYSNHLSNPRLTRLQNNGISLDSDAGYNTASANSVSNLLSNQPSPSVPSSSGPLPSTSLSSSSLQSSSLSPAVIPPPPSVPSSSGLLPSTSLPSASLQSSSSSPAVIPPPSSVPSSSWPLPSTSLSSSPPAVIPPPPLHYQSNGLFSPSRSLYHLQRTNSPNSDIDTFNSQSNSSLKKSQSAPIIPPRGAKYRIPLDPISKM